MWKSTGEKADAIVFVPQKSLKVLGFGVYNSEDEKGFKIRYEVEVDGF